MIPCDLCGLAGECSRREIEGREYNICSGCWNPLTKKLRGKGISVERETVFLPPVTLEPRREESKPGPGEPPKIWGGAPR